MVQELGDNFLGTWKYIFVLEMILHRIVYLSGCMCNSAIYSYYHSSFARGTIPKAMNEWRFPGMVFYYCNNEFILWPTYRMIGTYVATPAGDNCRMIGSYVATPPGNKKSISNVATNGSCPTIKWVNKKPTAEWNNCKQSWGDVLDNLLNKFRIDVT